MVNFLMRRTCQLTVALVLCTPALLADTFRLPNGVSAFGENPVFSRPSRSTIHGVIGIQAIVTEYQATSHRSQPVQAAEIKVSGRRTTSSAIRVVKFDHHSHQDRQIDYLAAVALAIQMIGIDRSTAFGRSQAGVVNNALWSLFTRPASQQYASRHNNGPRYLAKADSGKGHHGSRIPPNVWRPSPKDPPRDPKPPVRVPEASMASLLAFNGLVLAILGLCLRRRRAAGFVD